MKYALAITWTLVILFASSDLFSAAHTGEWITALARLIGFAPQHGAAGIWNAVLRKTGHVVAYALLGAAWFRALPRRRGAIFAVAIAFCVSTVDEVHQSFIPSRTGSAFDVLLDSSSAAVAVLICCL